MLMEEQLLPVTKASCASVAVTSRPAIDNEAANRESFRHGWFYTGDLGRMNADGYLSLTGRSKEILNRGGENLASRSRRSVDGASGGPAIPDLRLPDSQLGEEVGVAIVFATAPPSMRRSCSDSRPRASPILGASTGVPLTRYHRAYRKASAHWPGRADGHHH
jgi:hypothetical protein